MKKILSFVIALTMIVSLFIIPQISANAAGLNVGDYVYMGEYLGQTILWRCVSKDKTGTLMLSDRAICLKPFDAAGSDTSGSHARGMSDGRYRVKQGSNYWGDSNIRCWLNSQASAGNVVWACGNAPTKENVMRERNPYDQEAGFLTNFTVNELAAVRTVTQKNVSDAYERSQTFDLNSHQFGYEINIALQNYDEATSENFEDRMFLIDAKQANDILANETILGADYHNAHPTKAAVENSTYKSTQVSVYKNIAYWTRTPYVITNSSNVRLVNISSDLFPKKAYMGNYGVRPAFYINDSASFVSGDGSKENPYQIESYRKDKAVIEEDELNLPVDRGTPLEPTTPPVKEEKITVFVDGVELEFDQEPVMINDRTLVPIRAIFEALGAEVNWDEETQTATTVKDDCVVKLTIGSNKLYVNENEIELDVPAQMINDRTLVPARAVSESFGCDVQWIDEENKVVITTK